MSKLSVPVGVDDHMQGDPAAACVLVEYGDYQCPSCGQAYPIVKRLQKHFGKRLAFVFRNFPLTQLHPWAEPAAEAAEFAAAHGTDAVEDFMGAVGVMLMRPGLENIFHAIG